MNTKKCISLFLCFIMIFSTALTPSYATVFGTYYLGDKPQATDMAVVIRSLG